MQMTALKLARQIPLGVPLKDARTIFHDGSLKSLELTFENGDVLHIAGEYGVKASVKAPPKFIKKVKISSTLFGFPVSKAFDEDDSYEISKFMDALQESNGRDSDVVKTIIEVPEED